ncbi:unnamed protein product [Haemonchus placei]|uniref:Uncharacterized protein n=1 Tax=Haemonchus placei TaxID=6290 RepID=A0A0N4X2P7_HAEPC|nr:unnamed protein product [Haemonchus placei]
MKSPYEVSAVSLVRCTYAKALSTARLLPNGTATLKLSMHQLWNLRRIDGPKTPSSDRRFQLDIGARAVWLTTYLF